MANETWTLIRLLLKMKVGVHVFLSKLDQLLQWISDGQWISEQIYVIWGIKRSDNNTKYFFFTVIYISVTFPEHNLRYTDIKCQCISVRIILDSWEPNDLIFGMTQLSSSEIYPPHLSGIKWAPKLLLSGLSHIHPLIWRMQSL